nr:potassium ion transporter [Cryptococcus depauperatus CBS 7855]
MPSLGASLPTLPSHLALDKGRVRWKKMLLGSLNFYRIHLIAFTIIPLITSAVMYACNTEYHISYIDCLFNCMSSMTVTGLATINLSALNPFQQVLLFFQMIFGSLTFVSILMILVRLHFFKETFKHVIHEREKSRFHLNKTLSRVATQAMPLTAIRRRFGAAKRSEKVGNEHDFQDDHPSQPSPSSSLDKGSPHLPNRQDRKTEVHNKAKKKGNQKLRTDMIKRVQGGGVGLVNPMGWYDAEHIKIATPSPTPENKFRLPSSDDLLATDNGDELQKALTAAVESGAAQTEETTSGVERVSVQEPTRIRKQVSMDQPAVDRDTSDTEHEKPSVSPPQSPTLSEPVGHSKIPYAGLQLTDDVFPRSKTIAFEDVLDSGHDHRDRASTTQREGGAIPRTATFRSNFDSRIPYSATIQSSAGNFTRTYSLHPSSTHCPDPRLEGFGGFPTPLDITKRIFRKVFPETSKSLSRTFTVPRTNTISGKSNTGASIPESKEVPYITFEAIVGRNSRFEGLTIEQMDELGGVEYRALRILLYIVVGYFLFMQLAAFVIIAPYISAGGRYDAVFKKQLRYVSIPWFALYQSVSSFTNTGSSLCDTSMVPFQKAYLMIVGKETELAYLSNKLIWIIYKLVPKTSRLNESLKFLLDHPRRCFVYLFPATQTWVLALTMLGLTLIDWVSFLVLDLGTPIIMALPAGTRIASGFLQSVAVRAAGFSIVPIGNLAPAVKVLYVIMMYISVYPIALSVRATNVYEEKSLGLYGEDYDSDELSEDTRGAHAVAKYIGFHARRQLAFDIWWLAFALWLVCIIERAHIDNDSEWFNIFNIIFELVSAYGTVGLTVGLPYDNFSYCGAFRKLSKLVVIIVMLRGRHRGLPVAIDRAVMLPKDFQTEETAYEEEQSRRASRRDSIFNEETFPNRPGSFHGVPPATEVNISPGPTTAIPVPHHHPTHSIHRPQQHRRLNSFGGHTSLRTESPSFAPTSDDKRSQMGIKSQALTTVEESTMSRAPTMVEESNDSALEA